MKAEPVVLEGTSVRLEPLIESHWAALCEVGLDPELWRLIPHPVSDTAGMRAYIRAALDAQAAGTALPFAIVDRTADRPVGSSRFMNIDEPNRRLEIGATWIAKPWQRTAINTEAKYLMLRHAFETLECVRVELKTDALNHTSRKAILRLGAQEEGTLRSHVRTWTGRMRDTVYFSILQPEWPQVKKRLEARFAQHGPA